MDMSHPSSDQQSSAIWPILAFLGGMLLGFIPLLLFLSAFVRIGPLDPNIEMERFLMAVVFYITEVFWGLISLIIASWKKWSTRWIGGLYLALLLDFLIFGGLFFYLFNSSTIVPEF